MVSYFGLNYVIELKLRDNQESKARTREQLLKYMDGLLVNEAWVLVFDRKSTKSWKDKITWQTEVEPTGETVHVLGL